MLNNPTERFIIYKRLSKESRSGGLGLDAQQTAVSNFLKNKDHTILATFEEIETGTRKGNSRPALQQALKECKDKKATLLIARIDRLSRNVHFISGLMESGVNFIAVDNPYMTKFNAQILACVAELEAEMISKRTKAALAEAKKRGVILGNPQNLSPKYMQLGRENAAKARISDAKTFADALFPTIYRLKEGKMSLNKIANHLNTVETPSATGKIGVWDARKVQNILNWVKQEA
jgi:DNA invertase Pin-like site-specific DNA recombinase